MATSDILTGAEIAAIAERAEKATPGPWSWGEEGTEGEDGLWGDPQPPRSDWQRRAFGEVVQKHLMNADPGFVGVRWSENRAFIAAARSDITALLASHAALRDALAQTVAALHALSAGSVRVQRQWFRDHGMPEVADRTEAYSHALAQAALAHPAVRALDGPDPAP